MIKFCRFIAVVCVTIAATASYATKPGKVEPLMAKQLVDLPGKEALMITVSYEPGGADDIHRHDAHVFVYVLEGSIVMQVRGQPAVTLKPGQTFYEAPDDVHVVGKNASATEPAKFLVLLIKKTNTPPVLPAK
jgi:quercetin dioxygenase-like cupin family protein